jgi:hypothetical protein
MAFMSDTKHQNIKQREVQGAWICAHLVTSCAQVQ